MFRRYGDFCWLAERLQFERGGAIIYPLPPKQSGKYRFTKVFIDERQEHLQVFLRLVKRNPETGDSPSLDAFLHCHNDLFTAIRYTTNNETLNELLKQSITKEYKDDPTMFKFESSSKFKFHKKLMIKPSNVKHKYDDIFYEASLKANVLEAQLQLVIYQITLLSQRAEMASKGMNNLGTAFKTIADMETDKLSYSCEQMVKVTSQQSDITQSYVNDTKEALFKPLLCFVFVIIGWKAALMNRENKREEFAILLNKVAKRENFLKKISTMYEERSAALEAEEAAGAVEEVVEGGTQNNKAKAKTETPDAPTPAAAPSFAERKEKYYKERSKKKAAYLKEKTEQSKLAVSEINAIAEKMLVTYDAMNDRLYREMERYNEEKGEIMSEIVQHFATHEARYNQNGAKTWKSTLDFLQEYRPNEVSEESKLTGTDEKKTDPVTK